MGNADAAAGRTLPLLQDRDEVNAWTLWAVTYRDVVVLDAKNERRGVYNLTAHDLNAPENYAALKQLLLDARQ